MLKVAIVGCGKIADDHAEQIQRIKDCEIVAVCDREPLMARQICQRFPIKQHFSDLDILLAEAKPDVVHITTPPQSHFSIAKQCLEAGSHVYVEKPFAIDEQARRIEISIGTRTFNYQIQNYNDANPADVRYENDWGAANWGEYGTSPYPTEQTIFTSNGTPESVSVTCPKGNSPSKTALSNRGNPS